MTSLSLTLLLPCAFKYRASKAAHNQLLKTLSLEMTRRIAKNVTCLALHPGTVSTKLSAPFSGNVRAEKLFSPQQSAGFLLDVVNRAHRESLVTGAPGRMHGGFFAWDGQPIEW